MQSQAIKSCFLSGLSSVGQWRGTEESTNFKHQMDELHIITYRSCFCQMVHKEPQGEKSAQAQHCTAQWHHEYIKSNILMQKSEGLQNAPTFPNSAKRLQTEPGFLSSILSIGLSICTLSCFWWAFEIWFSSMFYPSGSLYGQRMFSVTLHSVSWELTFTAWHHQPP